MRHHDCAIASSDVPRCLRKRHQGSTLFRSKDLHSARQVRPRQITRIDEGGPAVASRIYIQMFQLRSVQTSCSLEGLCDCADLDAADPHKHLLAQQVVGFRARKTWKTLKASKLSFVSFHTVYSTDFSGYQPPQWLQGAGHLGRISLAAATCKTQTSTDAFTRHGTGLKTEHFKIILCSTWVHRIP